MQKIKFRKYQEEAVQNAVEMLFERGNSLVVAGTGAGKTITLAGVAGRFFNGFYAMHKRKPHILVLVHRTEIHDQNHTKFATVCPEIPTSEITANRKSLHGYVHFGMVQTVANLLEEFEAAGSFFDLIIIDEAHHSGASTYEDIINWNKTGKPDACLFGVTATPNRGDKLPLIHLYDNYNQITTKFLIDSHYLVRPTFKDFSPTFEVVVGKGKNQKLKEEKGHLAKNLLLDSKELVAELCKTYLAEKNKGKSIIFAPSHEFCTAIFNELSAMGRTPAYLSLGLDDVTRKSELERFEKGDADELINVDICTEGYDFPNLRNVVDFDTNGTHGQWVQKVGRGLRTADGKTSCTVVDFGGNIDLYPEGVETDVNLDGIVKKPKGEKLKESDLFKPSEEKAAPLYLGASAEQYTPYNAPKGFETVSDTDFGIVFVACGLKRDCIVVDTGNGYTAFVGDKASISQHMCGTFESCVKGGMACVGAIPDMQDKPIGKLQIQLLAPEYPTTALNWYGANCCICWKTWKDKIFKVIYGY